MLLSFNGVSFSFGAQEILNSASFIIRENSKAALIGRNGSGKTTIINLIKGLLAPAAGEIIKKRDLRLGFVEQHLGPEFDSMPLIDFIKLDFADIFALEARIKTLEHEIASVKGGFENSASYNAMMEEYSSLIDRYERCDGYSLISRINSVVAGLGFTPDERAKPLGQFSGGMKTRAQLCKLLLKEYDLIVLDEPTNYLDASSLDFLENCLKSSPVAALIVSHDRYFLDGVADRVLYLYNRKIEEFPGNYSDFSEIFEVRQNERIEEYERQQEFIKKTEEFYMKYKAGIKSKMARGRKKFVDRLERLTDPRIYSKTVKLDFSRNSGVESGRVVVSATGLKKAFGAKVLFEDASFEITRGSITGIIGGNGAGKTTLLKMILGREGGYEGVIRTGHNVVYGYQDQLLTGLDAKNRVIDEIWDIKRLMTEGEVRKYLAGFLFFGEEVFKPVAALSGGEKSRLIMAKIIMGGANTLVLDEPTNHLDIESKEVLEQALVNFDGTVIFVSHDRYFIDKVASGLIVIENRRIKYYDGNYTYYREKASGSAGTGPGGEIESDENGRAKPRTEGTRAENGGAKSEGAPSKQGLSKNAERMLRAELEKTEAEIGLTEDKISRLEAVFAANAVDGRPISYAELEKLNGEYASLKETLERLYEKWQAIGSELSL